MCQTIKALYIATKFSTMPSSPENKKRIAESWVKMKEDPDYAIKNGRLLFKRIFSVRPELSELFSFSTNYNNNVLDDEMYNDPKMRNHFALMFENIDAAVQLHLNGRDDEFNDRLKLIGKRHFGYGVRASHYSIVEESLVYTLETALGEEIFTPPVKAAWEKFFIMLSTSMMRGNSEAEDAEFTYKAS